MLVVDAVIGAATHKKSGDRLMDIHRKYPKMHVCLGIHPEFPEYYHEFDQVKRQIIENKENIIAIGEIGLPYYKLMDMKDSDKKELKIKGLHLLSRFLDLAETLHLPVILHAIEETAQAALDELEKRKIEKALFHWFEGPIDVMTSIIEKGYYISISPEVIYNADYAEFVKQVPLKNIVLESDGPWTYNGRQGTPSMVFEIIRYLSIQREINQHKLAEIIYQNTCHLFNHRF